MKIRFLGTSYGAPQKGRRQQSILIECGSDLYIFDAGAPVLDALLEGGYDPARIKAIFISHLHGDHMNGLMDIMNLCEHFKIKCPVFVSEKRGIKAFSDFAFFQHRKECKNLNFRLVRSGEFYSDENLRVDAILTEHMSPLPSYAFSVKSEEKQVVITGDLSHELYDFPRRKADLIITECAHFSAEAICEKIAANGTARAAIIHVAPCEKYKEFELLQKDLPFSLLLPCDNDEIVL